MAYLRWSSSPWHAFRPAHDGEGDDAVLAAWHVHGAAVTATAGELLRAGYAGEPTRLRAFMERCIRAEGPAKQAAKQAALQDVEVLAPAVDRFLFDVANGGRIVMPLEVAHRYRELKRWIDDALAEPCSRYPVDSRGVPMLFAWSAELDAIRRCYPPPRVPREIRELMHARALRMLRVEEVLPEQDALERARIAAACEWPRS